MIRLLNLTPRQILIVLHDLLATAAAILDQHRQVIAFNASYLAASGVDDPREVLGLRPGEALDCIHPQDTGKGCGTTHACPTCGAALVILSALRGQADERRCALRLLRDGVVVDREFRARATPVRIEGLPVVLLVLRDVSAEARRAMLERSFMHGCPARRASAGCSPPAACCCRRASVPRR